MAETGQGQVPGEVTTGSGVQADEGFSAILQRLAREFLPPFIVLIFLFILVLGIFLLARVVGFSLPEGLQQFIFLVFVFFGFGVFITRVLMETFKIQVNGWALSGTLAVMFLFTYFITEKYEAVAAILGFQTSVAVGSGLPLHTLAEVRLACKVEDSGDEPEEHFTRQSHNFYTFIDGASDYIGYVREELTKLGSYPTRVIDKQMAEYGYFANIANRSNSTSWVAYAVPQASLVEGFVPIPTQLNKLHETVFYVDSIVPGADAIGNVNFAPEAAEGGPAAAPNREFVEVARLVIEPGELVDSPHEGDGGSPGDASGADGSLRARHKIKLIMNVIGGKVSCWTPATDNF